LLFSEWWKETKANEGKEKDFPLAIRAFCLILRKVATYYGGEGFGFAGEK